MHRPQMTTATLTAREYGTTGPQVVLLHGGPGTAGYLAPLARELADTFRVLEPWQRGSGSESLTVGRHVEDLQAFLARRNITRPAIVGHSWGAMLALCHAAAYPDSVAALVLIGCGTFDPAARGALQLTVEHRIDASLRTRLSNLAAEFPDPDQRLRAMGNLLLPVYSYGALTQDPVLDVCDWHAHHETWEDMLRLQIEGLYPAVFATIRVPVLMLHGAADPHPGALIQAGLKRFLPQLEYREWAPCGHFPWLEVTVRTDFLDSLRHWLTTTLCPSP